VFYGGFHFNCLPVIPLNCDQPPSQSAPGSDIPGFEQDALAQGRIHRRA
jgi:hypothetical protein